MKEEFKIELLGIYPLEDCLEKEAELAKTSLFPKGLNGNAGRYVEFTQEVRQKMSSSARLRIERGDNPICSPEWNQKMLENKTHPFLGGEVARQINRKRVANGTHHLLGGEIQRKLVRDNRHHLLGGEIQRNSNQKRVYNGTHHFLKKGYVAALNIETNIVARVPVEIFHSKPDVYFSPSSKTFKEWKMKTRNKC